MAYWLMPAADGPRHEYPARRVPKGWVTSHCSQGEHQGADVADGDGIGLVRTGRHGGIVAHGRVTAVKTQPRPYDCCVQYKIMVQFEELYLGSPVQLRLLPGIASREKSLYARSSRLARQPFLGLSEDAWRVLVGTVRTPRVQEWPVSWDLKPGAVVSRADLHDTYGGQRQGRIVRSASTPNTFVFLSAGATAETASHRWADDGALLLVGKAERASDDPAVAESFENRYVLQHLRSGIPLRVFHSAGRKPLIYLGEVVVDQENAIEEWIEAAAPSLPAFAEDRARRRSTAHLQFRAPILRVHPVTELEPFLAPERQSRRQPQKLRLGVAGPHEPDSGPISGSPSGASAIRQATDFLRSASADEDISGMGDAAALADLITRRHRAVGLAELRRLVRDPGTLEADLQRLLEQHTWIFGGEYLGPGTRRELVQGEQLDIPLIRGDGTLHGVEIKKANIKTLVVRNHNHLGVGAHVHNAVVQAMNYLRELDEHRHIVLGKHRVDCRRASMTIVIGDSSFVRPWYTAEEIAEAIRTYNAYISRIKVVTYTELINNAQRSLDLAETSDTASEPGPSRPGRRPRRH
jgi:antiviral defense system Shedu protein SduA